MDGIKIYMSGGKILRGGQFHQLAPIYPLKLIPIYPLKLIFDSSVLTMLENSKYQILSLLSLILHNPKGLPFWWGEDRAFEE